MFHLISYKYNFQGKKEEMLSSVFLVFEDREMRLTFDKTKKAYYGRILLILWPMLILLTAGLVVLDVLDQFVGQRRYAVLVLWGERR